MAQSSSTKIAKNVEYEDAVTRWGSEILSEIRRLAPGEEKDIEITSLLGERKTYLLHLSRPV